MAWNEKPDVAPGEWVNDHPRRHRKQRMEMHHRPAENKKPAAITRCGL